MTDDERRELVAENARLRAEKKSADVRWYGEVIRVMRERDRLRAELATTDKIAWQNLRQYVDAQQEVRTLTADLARRLDSLRESDRLLEIHRLAVERVRAVLDDESDDYRVPVSMLRAALEGDQP